jgi:hypothetical protein
LASGWPFTGLFVVLRSQKSRFTHAAEVLVILREEVGWPAGAGRKGRSVQKQGGPPMRVILVVVSTLLLLLGAMAQSALAQVPPDPHNHFLTVPGTGNQVQVAPNRCDLGETVQGAFLQFHFNVHVGVPAETGGLIITPDFC